MNLKTKIFLQSGFVLIAFAVALQVGAVWTGPNAQPPNNNGEPPVTVGQGTQIKDGSFVALGIKSNSVLIVEGTSTLKDNVTISPNKNLTINGQTYLFPSALGSVNDVLKISSIAGGVATLSWGAGGGGTITLTGDVTGSGTNTIATTIANNAVTNAKIADNTIVATDKLTATGTKSSSTFLRGDNTWASPGVLPSGTNGQTIRHNGTNWIANSFLYNDGTKIGVNTTTPENLFAITQTGPVTKATHTTYPFAIKNSGNTNDFTAGSDGGAVYLQSWNSKHLRINDQGNNTLINPGSGCLGVGVDPGNNCYKFHVIGETRLVGTGGNPSLTAMSGNVGIGNSTPAELLSIGSNSGGNMGTMSLSNAVSGKVTIQPQATSFTSYTLTLPSTAGTNGQFLQTNGSGVLSWASGGGDNLGNHTATQALQMKGFTIFGNDTANGNLTLDSTSNGTFKGNVILNPVNGNVGVGTASPLVKLDVFGPIGTTLGNASSPSHSFRTDLNTGMFSPSADTIAFSLGGVEKIRFLTSGDALINGLTVGKGNGSLGTNTAFGVSALGAATAGANTAIGSSALSVSTSATNNTAVGISALEQVTTGGSNTALGGNAGLTLTTGINNLLVGYSADTTATASGVVAIGNSAKANANNAVALGQGAIASGLDSVAIGQGTTASASNSIAIGKGVSNSTANSIVFGNSSINTNTFNGGVIVNSNNSAKPSCTSTTRGMFFVVQGASGVKDNVEVCAKDASNIYLWRTIY